jgi:hypothetical protein
MKLSKSALGMICLIAWSATPALADIRSKDPKDLYTMRFTQVAQDKVVLELCGPKGCNPVGPASYQFDENEVTALRDQEKFEKITKEIATPLLWLGGPAFGAINGAQSARVAITVSEKFAPKLLEKLTAKYGKQVTYKLIKGGMVTFDIVKYGVTAIEIADEFFEPGLNTAALQVLSDDALNGKDVMVDYSIQRMAKHMAASITERQNARALTQEQKDDPQFNWPI